MSHALTRPTLQLHKPLSFSGNLQHQDKQAAVGGWGVRIHLPNTGLKHGRCFFSFTVCGRSRSPKLERSSQNHNDLFVKCDAYVCINVCVSQRLCLHGYKLLRLISELHVTVEETVSEFALFEPLEFSQFVTQSVQEPSVKAHKTGRKSSHFPSPSTSPAPKGCGRFCSPSRLPRGQCRHFITGPHRKTNNHCKQPRTHTSASLDVPVHLTCML